MKELFRIGLLEVPTADFEARNVRGDRDDRHTAAVGIVEAIDQMEIPRSAPLFFAIGCRRLLLQVLPRRHLFHGAQLRRAAVQQRPHMDDLLACAPRDPGPAIRVRGIGQILVLLVFGCNRRL
jgi:hypothetical protein